MTSILDNYQKNKSEKQSKYTAGSVERIYEYHEKSGKDASGHTPICIKPEAEEKKSKKSLN